MLHHFFKLVRLVLIVDLQEFDRREQPNHLIPKLVYDVRRQTYVFWELQRLARGMPKTFTHSDWDEKAVSNKPAASAERKHFNTDCCVIQA